MTETTATITETAADIYRTLDDFREANRRAGFHFFDQDTLRFFRSRIVDEIYAGRFFITSEQFEGTDGHREPRRYTVRVAMPDGSTRSRDIGEFQQWATLAEAREMAQAAATGYHQGLTAPAIEGPDGNYKLAYNAGHELRQFERGLVPDKYGNYESDYLRERERRLRTQADELGAEAARLEALRNG